MRSVRTIFLALVFLNVAYFAWAHWVDAPRRAPAGQTTHLPQLRLADELNDSRQQRAAPGALGFD